MSRIRQTRGIHPIGKAAKSVGVLGFDPDQDRPEVPRRFLQVFEPGDVVIGAKHLQKFTQRAGALRHPQDEVLLQRRNSAGRVP